MVFTCCAARILNPLDGHKHLHRTARKEKKEMSFLRNLFGSKQLKKQRADKKPLKKRSSDGYLLPEYWRCIVCKACKEDKQAAYAVRPMIFMMAIKDDRHYQELGQTERAAIREYTQFISDPIGALKEQPTGTEHLEDTAGLARDRGGMGFDAVFLCDTHVGEMNKAIEALGKEGSK